MFIARTDAEAEAPILWPSDAKNWLLRKDPYAGKDWRQEEEGMTEDEMAGWHHWLNGHEFEQALGVGEGQEAWHAAVHGVAKSQTWLRDWTTTTYDLKVKETDIVAQGNQNAQLQEHTIYVFSTRWLGQKGRESVYSSLPGTASELLGIEKQTVGASNLSDFQGDWLSSGVLRLLWATQSTGHRDHGQQLLSHAFDLHHFVPLMSFFELSLGLETFIPIYTSFDCCFLAGFLTVTFLSISERP